MYMYMPFNCMYGDNCKCICNHVIIIEIIQWLYRFQAVGLVTTSSISCNSRGIPCYSPPASWSVSSVPAIQWVTCDVTLYLQSSEHHVTSVCTISTCASWCPLMSSQFHYVCCHFASNAWRHGVLLNWLGVNRLLCIHVIIIFGNSSYDITLDILNI